MAPLNNPCSVNIGGGLIMAAPPRFNIVVLDIRGLDARANRDQQRLLIMDAPKICQSAAAYPQFI
jgi:hypothetical protein